jgi:hypothetical protein
MHSARLKRIDEQWLTALIYRALPGGSGARLLLLMSGKRQLGREATKLATLECTAHRNHDFLAVRWNE